MQVFHLCQVFRDYVSESHLCMPNVCVCVCVWGGGGGGFWGEKMAILRRKRMPDFRALFLKT